MGRTFINAGWPYLYDVPGLHNCVPMLFADVYARFHRLGGDEVFFLSGGDEHGSRVEFVARGLRRHPQGLVDEKYAATVPLLEAMGISLDTFARTTDPRHGRFVGEYLARLFERGLVRWRDFDIPYCARCAKHLPDRFVQGRCPHCGDVTYGGQCNNKKTCGRVIASLRDGRCAVCGGGVEFRGRAHLSFPTGPYRPAILPQLRSSKELGPEVLRRVEETFRDVPEAALTRDTPWGIRFPIQDDPGRTVYSWADSLLAKVTFAPEAFWRDPDARRLFFLGMDGVPFYGVLLPSLLLASEEGYSVSNWTLLPNAVLIYEGGVCSKSTGTGIWLQEALSVLEGDLWRFHIYHTYAHAERHADFRWERFAQAVNEELIGGLEGNLARAALEASPGPADTVRLDGVRSLLLGLETAAAFTAVMDLVRDPAASRATLLEATSLLSCFLPRIAARARLRLLGSAVRVFEGGPLSHRALRARYQALVDERRDRLSLEEDITGLRADSLCVCPIDLKEQ
ncbi:MAG: class I tRNA ligase family protein [Planctomycetes bacterium]|nr:class I tRNA ligase family protein [Planctomycetota bacterium]